MKSCFFLFFLFLITGFVQAQFVHPGLTNKKSDLDRVKYMVEAKIDPWYTSYNTMISDSKASYNYTVRGNSSFTELGRDDGTNYNAWNDDIRAAYYNAIQWYVTGDSRHAEKSIEIFKAWKNLKNVTSGGTASLSGAIVYIMVEAAEIIKSTYTGWSPTDIQDFKNMLVYPGYSNIVEPAGISRTTGSFYWQAYQGDPVRHGNQGLAGFRAVMAMGIFMDNKIMYDRALRYLQGLPHRSDDIAYPSGPPQATTLSSAGDYEDTYNYTVGNSIPDFGYNEVMTNYIYANGQCQESSRDQQHTFFGIGNICAMAEMAWNQGDDLYSHVNDRLLLGLEYTTKYNVSYLQSYLDQPTQWIPTVASGEFTQRFNASQRVFAKFISPTNIGDYVGYRPILEMPLAHYYGRGFKTSDQVKWTTRARDVAFERSGYEAAGHENGAIGWGALTSRRPAGCYGDPISGFETNGLPMYAMNVLPGTIEAEKFDYDPIKKGEGRVYHDLSSTNTGGTYRTMDNVDIEATIGGGYNLTSIESGEWLTYTVSVPETAEYRFSIRYAASQTGGTIKLSAGGQEMTTNVAVPFGAPNSASVSEWKDFIVSNSIVLEKGVQSFKLNFGGISGAFKLDNFTIVKSGIVKQDQSIKMFSIPNKVLGTADYDPNAKASSGLAVGYASSNPAVATIVSGKIHFVGTGKTTITATQTGDANYNVAPSVSEEIIVIDAIAGTLILSTIADSYVYGAAATTNYGTATSLVTKAASTSRYAYFKFDLSSVPGTIISAKLRLYQRTANAEIRNVYDVIDDSWTETGVTWNNKPAYENERASIITSKSTWNEWDVSSYVAQEYANDKMVTMVVNDPKSTSLYGIDFYSKEFGSNAPELIIEYSTNTLNVKTEEIPLTFYPNPVVNVLSISLASTKLNINETHITISSLSGQFVMQTKVDSAEVRLDLSKLSSGVYIVTIQDKSKKITRKIVKL